MTPDKAYEYIAKKYGFKLKRYGAPEKATKLGDLRVEVEPGWVPIPSTETALYEALRLEVMAKAALQDLLNTAEVEDFDKALPLEAGHQVLRWGTENDAGKTPYDWFWLIGYLAGKALAACLAGNTEKAKHHCISTAAALRNWHAHIRTGATIMRPGIDPPTHQGN